jgi:hypothetical protein
MATNYANLYALSSHVDDYEKQYTGMCPTDSKSATISTAISTHQSVSSSSHEYLAQGHLFLGSKAANLQSTV